MSKDILVCAWRELKTRWFRSAAVTSGYCVTVILMILTASILLFSRTAENEIMGATGTHFVCFMPNCGDITSLTEVEIAQLAKGIIPQKCKELCQNCTGCNKKPIDILNEGFVINTNTTRLLSIDLVTQIRNHPAVKDASGYLMFRFRDPQTGNLFSVGGLDPDSTAVETTCFSSADIVSGISLSNKCASETATAACCSKIDMVSGAPLCSDKISNVVVDVAYASSFGLKPGSVVTIASEAFNVAGIVNSGVRPGKADIYMLFSDAERVMNRRIQNPLFHEANVILVESVDAQNHDRAIEAVKSIVQSDAIVTYGCYKPAAEAMGLNARSIWLFMLLIGLGTVVFAARTQLTSIVERRRQIAVLKAVGWKNSVLTGQIIVESLILSTAGSACGMVVSLLVLKFVPVIALLGIDAQLGGIFNWQLMLLVVGFAVVSGVLAGLFPVMSMVRHRPAEALRRC